MNVGCDAHLGYCSNIHAGETWPEVRANLERYALRVRDRVAPGRPFGLGLRLSARAAAALSEARTLTEFQTFLAAEQLYVFTVNGFPHGAFHGTAVKAAVYEPDWRDPERLRYTLQLADLLAALLPEGETGSLSTVPLGYKTALGGALPHMVDHLLQAVAGLVQLRARTGRRVALALEPEPDCVLETTDEVLALFGRHLHGETAVQRLRALTGLERNEAQEALRVHLGLCLDACHAAVEFESASAVVDALRAADVRIHKVQISAGLRLPRVDAEGRALLQRFNDPVYLHQVVERSARGLRRFPDLPQALAAGAAPEAEWRVHFHVPVFLEQLGGCASTQGFLRDLLALHRARPVSPHLEVETYTWDVLPAPWRDGPVDEAIARELDWVRKELTR